MKTVRRGARRLLPVRFGVAYELKKGKMIARVAALEMSACRPKKGGNKK